MISFFLVNPTREKSAISILVSYDGHAYRRSIGESVPTSLWNKTKQRVKVTKDFSMAGYINDIIDDWEKAAIETTSHFKHYMEAPSKDDFFSFFNSIYYEKQEQSGEVWFSDYVSSYIEKYKHGKSISCVKKYTTTLNKVKQYETERKLRLSFEDINIDFYNDFREWFFDKGYSTNYFGNTIKVIKQIFNEAKYVEKLHDYSGIEHKDFIGTRVNTDSVYLNEDELSKLYNLNLSEESIRNYYQSTYSKELDSGQLHNVVYSWNIIRDRFLIGAYTGLRVSDYGRLGSANIGEKFIHIRTKKTDTDTVIPINTMVRTIIARNDLSVTVSDQKMNKHIKEICRMAAINNNVLIYKSISGKRKEFVVPKYTLICTHTARRSFATNAYKAGVPTIAIMKITGHTKESTFLSYIKVSAEENAEMLMKHSFFK